MKARRDPRRVFGDKGENLAARFLEEKGLVVIERQYRSRSGEIDLICLDGEEIVFVEVKTRRTQMFGYPEESVTEQKIQHLLKTAQNFLQDPQWIDRPWRIDVVAITSKKEAQPEIMHFPSIDIPERLW